ncbi:MAG TPA: aldehyde dehydrogenase family protein, partial [Acetobacteraceae bacterium]|nr:aldehyde dehydrogenase family protein [Acetobacteraceae bacterium]
MSLPKYQVLIGGARQDAASGEYFETHDPYKGAPWALIPRCAEADANRAVEAASAVFQTGAWPAMTATQRGALLRKLGDLIAERAEDLAQTEVRDNGKLITEMLGQTRYVPQWYYYYGGLADKVEGGVLPIDKAGVFNFTRWEPLGVVV